VSLHRDESGLTLLELVLSTMILALIALGVQSASLVVFRAADVGNALVQQSAGYGRTLQLLSQDLRQPALAGISIGGSTYNTANTIVLTWTDQTTTPVTTYSVTYSISGSDLVRAMTRTQGAVVTNTSVVAARDLDPAGASGGAQFSRTVGAPGVVRTLLTIKVGSHSATYDFTVEQRP
jgi:hypothetical protein